MLDIVNTVVMQLEIDYYSTLFLEKLFLLKFIRYIFSFFKGTVLINNSDIV